MGDVGSLLIPGIPNDIALSCLVRVPVNSHNAMIQVSKGWRKLLLDRNSLFYSERTQLGLHQPMVFLSPHIYTARQKDTITRFFHKGAGFCPYKSLILVFGGEQGCEDATENGIATKSFYIVDTLTRKIRQGPDMVFPTSAYAHSAFGILNDCLYVAGGLKQGYTLRDQGHSLWTNSAQCYDISSNTWRPICPMPFQVVPHTFFVAYGDFVVKGMKKNASDGLHYYLSYSPVSDSWKVRDGTEHMEKLTLVAAGNADADDGDDGDDDDDDDNEEVGPLTTETYFFGMFVLGVTNKDGQGFKWKNMGDVGRLLQQSRRDELNSDLTSLVPRDTLPSISLIDDVDGKELKFKAQFRIVKLTGVKTPHHSNWYDLPLLFYPVCGQFSMGHPDFMRTECMAFDFVVVYY